MVSVWMIMNLRGHYLIHVQLRELCFNADGCPSPHNAKSQFHKASKSDQKSERKMTSAWDQNSKCGVVCD